MKSSIYEFYKTKSILNQQQVFTGTKDSIMIRYSHPDHKSMWQIEELKWVHTGQEMHSVETTTNDKAYRIMDVYRLEKVKQFNTSKLKAIAPSTIIQIGEGLSAKMYVNAAYINDNTRLYTHVESNFNIVNKSKLGTRHTNWQYCLRHFANFMHDIST